MEKSKKKTRLETNTSSMRSKVLGIWKKSVNLFTQKVVFIPVGMVLVISIISVALVSQNSSTGVDSISPKNSSSEDNQGAQQNSSDEPSQSPTPISTKSPSPKASSSGGTGAQAQVFEDNWTEFEQSLSTCQLQETSNISGAGSKGFPARRSIPSTGNIKIAIIPVDFSNAVGSGDPQAMFRDDVNQIVSWGAYFSRGKMSYEVDLSATSWIRAPRGADWYTCTSCGKGSTVDKQPQQAGIQELVSAADPYYDFSGVDYLYFVVPIEAEQQFGTAPIGGGTFNSNEGSFTAQAYGEMGASYGIQTDRTKIWDHAVHEILHPQGFIGHGPSNGSGYYISTDQWGPSKAVTSWEAFLNGWFDSNEVLCLRKETLNQETYISLDSIDNFGPGKESIMIRLSSDELIVIERRGPGPFSSVCSGCFRPNESGFTAYRVNVNAAQFRDDSDPNGDSKNFWSYLGVQGKPVITNFVEYSGVKITRISDTQVKISVS
jgi:hypothetical protein